MQAKERIPRLTIGWTKQPAQGFEHVHQAFQRSREPSITLGTEGYIPAPFIRNTPRRAVAVFGCPILGDRIAIEQVCNLFMEDRLPSEERIAEINGQFLILIYAVEKNELTVINDRFNGIPLYFANLPGGFYGSFLYADLFRELQAQNQLTLNPEPMLEAVYFQRVMGYKTIDQESEFLAPASILNVTAAKFAKRRYWRPDFTKRNLAANDAGKEFAFNLRRSVERLSSDTETSLRRGLFLSGGHDSRTVLAGFTEPPTCFTVAFSENLEVACARRATEAVHGKHVFLRLQEAHFVDHFNTMTELCGGMFANDNALFLGMHMQVHAHADVLFHGHGFDYMFHGMYIPSTTMEIFGRPTFLRRLSPITGDLAQFFMNNLPFRIRDTDVFGLLRRDRQDDLRSYVLSEIKQLLAESGEASCVTDYDRWEFLCTHALGRHYSHPNIASQWCNGIVRTIAFDNDLYDLYQRLPLKLRLHADCMRYAMREFAPELARIPTGNYGIAAGATPLYKTCALIGRKLLRDFAGMKHLRPPQAQDRTWPDRDTYLRTHRAYAEIARRAVRSDELRAAMPYFDWEKIESLTPGWLHSGTGGGKFLVSLISLYRFLEQMGQKSH